MNFFGAATIHAKLWIVTQKLVHELLIAPAAVPQLLAPEMVRSGRNASNELPKAFHGLVPFGVLLCKLTRLYSSLNLIPLPAVAKFLLNLLV